MDLCSYWLIISVVNHNTVILECVRMHLRTKLLRCCFTLNHHDDSDCNFCQAHPDELGTLIEILKSGMVTSALGSQYRLSLDAKCDTMGALWRILGVNNSAQKVFGDATGFSLLLTTLHGFQSDGGDTDPSSLNVYIKVFTYLLRVVTAGVSDNAVNRMKLHTTISSQTFFDLLSESGLLCVEHEKQVIQLMLELALEIVIPPFLASEGLTKSNAIENESSHNLLLTPSGPINPEKERVYNASAVRVLIRSLLLLTPMVQLKLLDLIENLAHAGPFNQESLTSSGVYYIVCCYLLFFNAHLIFWLYFRLCGTFAGHSPTFSFGFVFFAHLCIENCGSPWFLQVRRVCLLPLC